MKAIPFIFLFAVLTAQAIDPEVLERFGIGRQVSGTEFFVAFPQNEARGSQIENRRLEIYVTSEFDTEVTLEYQGNSITKLVNALEITTFSTLNRNELSWDMEVYRSETPEDKSIRITSPDSISVMVLSSKQQSSDSYLALPVNVWGTEYRHISYYDHLYTAWGRQERGSGFLIIASSDNTTINISLQGKTGNNGETTTRRNVGDNFKVILDKGETYVVKGNGETYNRFDLSGSLISSDKPIGILSFQTRTTMPSSSSWSYYLGADILLEMVPPVNTWSTRYYSLEFKRNNPGDFFRIMSSRDSTNFSVSWYNPQTFRLISSIEGRLDNAGDFYEYNNDINSNRAIEGIAIWESDKPCLIMQYPYSSDRDNSLNIDPSMVMMINEGQFVKRTVFQVPDDNSFEEHYLNLFILGDSTDANLTDLKNLRINGSPVYNQYSSLLNNRIPGTNFYFQRLDLEPGAYILESSALFGAYLYGMGDYDSYALPVALSLSPLEIDTMNAQITISEISCGRYSVDISELRNGSLSDVIRQVEFGIKEVRLEKNSENFILRSDTNLPIKPKTTSLELELEVINKSLPGTAYITALDHADNEYTNTVSYPDEERPIVEFKIEDRDTIPVYNPGDSLFLTVAASSPDWQYISLDSIIIEIAYIKEEIGFNGIFEPDSFFIGSGWEFSFKENIEEDSAFFRVTLKGNQPLMNDTVIFRAGFITYLTGKSQYLPEIRLAGSNVDPGCMISESDNKGAEINVGTCVFNLRDVEFGDDFEFQAPAPNPINNDILNLNFTLGINAPLVIQLFNSNGELVSSIFDGQFFHRGRYELSHPFSGLPNGIYFIKLQSGPFAKSHSFVLHR